METYPMQTQELKVVGRGCHEGMSVKILMVGDLQRAEADLDSVLVLLDRPRPTGDPHDCFGGRPVELMHLEDLAPIGEARRQAAAVAASPVRLLWVDRGESRCAIWTSRGLLNLGRPRGQLSARNKHAAPDRTGPPEMPRSDWDQFIDHVVASYPGPDLQ